MTLTREQADAVYSVLVEECGATDDHMSFDRDSFVHYFTNTAHPEFRFQGQLGFGGKCRMDSHHPIPRVDYYPEDYSVARENMIDRANARIQELFS